MDTNAVSSIAKQELTINIRNKWTLIFAGVFSALVLAISYFGMITAGAIGFQGFTRTSASLLNLVLYIVPLLVNYQRWYLVPFGVVLMALLSAHINLAAKREERTISGEFLGVISLTFTAPGAFRRSSANTYTRVS